MFKHQLLGLNHIRISTGPALASIVSNTGEIVPLLEYTFQTFFAERLLPKYTSGIALIGMHEPP